MRSINKVKNKKPSKNARLFKLKLDSMESIR